MSCKTFIALSFLAITMALTNAPEVDDVNLVRNINQKLDAALSSSDTAALDQLLANNYVEVNAQGELSDKGQLVAFARARKSAPAGIVVGPERKVSEQAIRMHGDTAIVIHTISIKHLPMDYQTSGNTPAQAPQIVDQETRMRVYSRTGSAWQLVAQQTTSIPKR